MVTQIPFLFNIWFSLQDWKIVPPRGPDFTGLENFTEGYSNTFFLDAVGISIGMTTAAVLLSLLVGTGLALLLDRQFFGRGIARTLLITPFLIMPVVAGLLWKNQIFSSTFGVAQRRHRAARDSTPSPSSSATRSGPSSSCSYGSGRRS